MEHIINYTSIQEWRGQVGEGDLEDDGDGFDSLELQLHKELKLTFECSCGRKFRKERTAAEHLEEKMEQ